MWRTQLESPMEHHGKPTPFLFPVTHSMFGAGFGGDPPPFVCCSLCVFPPCPAAHVCSALPAWMFCFPSVAQKIVSTKKKQQLSIGPCKSLPNSPSHSSVCSAQVSAVHISQVQIKSMLGKGTDKLLFISDVFCAISSALFAA